MESTKGVELNKDKNVHGGTRIKPEDLPITGEKNKGQYSELNPPKTDMTQKPWEPKFKDEPENVIGYFADRKKMYLPSFMNRSAQYFDMAA